MRLLIDYPDRQIEAPDDLMHLYEAAPKIKRGPFYGFPSKRTREGRAFYAKVREIADNGGEVGIPLDFE